MYRQIISQARVHHVIQCFSSLYFEGHNSTWYGDNGEGSYCYSDGQGNVISIAWNFGGVVAFAFDHEFPNEYDLPVSDRMPLSKLWNLPEYMRPLGEEAASRVDRLATHGLWANNIRVGVSDPWSYSGDGIDLLRGFTLDAESAVFGSQLFQNWLELSSVSETQARLAMKLARAHETPVVISREDEHMLLTPPDQSTPPPTRENTLATAKSLAEIGIQWNIPQLTDQQGLR